jgi:hypothetical protein
MHFSNLYKFVSLALFNTNGGHSFRPTFFKGKVSQFTGVHVKLGRVSADSIFVAGGDAIHAFGANVGRHGNGQQQSEQGSSESKHPERSSIQRREY